MARCALQPEGSLPHWAGRRGLPAGTSTACPHRRRARHLPAVERRRIEATLAIRAPHRPPTAIAPRPDVDSARLLCACSCSCLSRRSSPSSYATKLRHLGKYSHKPRLDEHEMCPPDWVLAPTLTNRRLGHRHAIERLDQIVCNGSGSPMHDRFCVLRPLLPLEKVNGTLRTSTPEP
jgi:hypothetical protein